MPLNGWLLLHLVEMRQMSTDSNRIPLCLLPHNEPYANPLQKVLQYFGLSDLLVEGKLSPYSPWALQPEDPPGSQVVSLTLNDHIFQNILQAFRQPKPRTKLASHASSICVSPVLYQMFFGALPLDAHIGTMHKHRGLCPTLQSWNAVIAA